MPTGKLDVGLILEITQESPCVLLINRVPDYENIRQWALVLLCEHWSTDQDQQHNQNITQGTGHRLCFQQLVECPGTVGELLDWKVHGLEHRDEEIG